jgi:hypothetical protein
MTIGEMAIMVVLVAPPFAYIMTVAVAGAWFSARFSYHKRCLALMEAWPFEEEGDEDGKSNRP